MTILNKLISKFKKIFSSLDPDDLAQDIYFYYEEGVDNFRRKYPDSEISEGFLSSHIYNRILNSLRRTYRRFDSPCKSCPLAAFQKGACMRFKKQEDCGLYFKWAAREDRRSTLNAVAGPPPESAAVAADFVEAADAEMDLAVILPELRRYFPSNLREDFAVFLAGGVLPKEREAEILEACKEIWKKRNMRRGD